MFYLLLNSARERDNLIRYLGKLDIHAVFHYVPLHTSLMGRQMGYRDGDLPVTEDLSTRLVRLPCYFELRKAEQDHIIRSVYAFFGRDWSGFEMMRS
jgi:dTDP-4-amino-4,6-dideoxygalactose transaminase